MDPEQSRSQRARTAVERALVRVVHHYGTRPEFVLEAFIASLREGDRS